MTAPRISQLHLDSGNDYTAEIEAAKIPSGIIRIHIESARSAYEELQAQAESNDSAAVLQMAHSLTNYRGKRTELFNGLTAKIRPRGDLAASLQKGFGGALFDLQFANGIRVPRKDPVFWNKVEVRIIEEVEEVYAQNLSLNISKRLDYEPPARESWSEFDPAGLDIPDGMSAFFWARLEIALLAIGAEQGFCASIDPHTKKIKIGLK